jgi:hypothetical protein
MNLLDINIKKIELNDIKILIINKFTNSLVVINYIK